MTCVKNELMKKVVNINKVDGQSVHTVHDCMNCSHIMSGQLRKHRAISNKFLRI